MIRVFMSYSHADEKYRNELEKHLMSLKRQGLIESWHDRRIAPGEEWENRIDEELRRADIILLLVSSDFINSDYCYNLEMTESLARHERDDAAVIPVILRSCNWTTLPFGKLQAATQDGKPVEKYPCWDDAFLEITKKIEAIANKLCATSQHSSAALSSSSADQLHASEGSPGYLDKLAATETALVEISGIMGELTTVIAFVNHLLVTSREKAQRSDNSGGGFSGRLTTANQLAEDLESKAIDIELKIVEYEQRIKKLSLGVDYLLQRFEEDMSSASGHDFIKALLSFASAINAAGKESKKFSASMTGLGEASRSLRKACDRISRIMKRFRAVSAPASTWYDRLLRIQHSVR